MGTSADSSHGSGAVTQLLEAAAKGEAGAAEALLPLVYKQLRGLARQRMARERAGHTLQATALVSEAYLRLVGDEGRAHFAGSAHFFHAAGEAMRRILIEHARARGRFKRGGGVGRRRVPLNVVDLATEVNFADAVALDEAFCRLEQESPDAAEVVRLRFYAGLSVEETAATLGVSPRTVNRAWTYARAWLFEALEGSQG